MIIEVLPVGPLQVNCVILGCSTTRKAAVIDPGDDFDSIVAILKKHQLQVEIILNTHGHFDHIGANAALKKSSGAPIYIHPEDKKLLQLASAQGALYGLTVPNSPPADHELDDGQKVQFGEQEFTVLHTPGHSPGGVCFYTEGLLISGDTLFAGSVGRTDLPGGSHQQLLDSIRTKLAGLPAPTRVIPGHGPDTSMGQELRYNPFLND